MLKAWGHIQKKDDSAEQVTYPAHILRSLSSLYYMCVDGKVSQHRISNVWLSYETHTAAVCPTLAQPSGGCCLRGSSWVLYPQLM